MKNVYYNFLTTNINLFLNAYLKQDYQQLHKSFYSVSLSISSIDILKSHIVPFIKYYLLDRMELKGNCCCFSGKWYKYKEWSRKKGRESEAKIKLVENGYVYMHDEAEIKNGRSLMSGSYEPLTLWHKDYENMTHSEFLNLCREKTTIDSNSKNPQEVD